MLKQCFPAELKCHSSALQKPSHATSHNLTAGQYSYGQRFNKLTWPRNINRMGLKGLATLKIALDAVFFDKTQQTLKTLGGWCSWPDWVVACVCGWDF
jgi:hypothetical protein